MTANRYNGHTTDAAHCPRCGSAAVKLLGGFTSGQRVGICQDCRENYIVEPTITDGFGSTWPARCPRCGAPMQVIRPGDARCSAECWLGKEDDMPHVTAGYRDMARAVTAERDALAAELAAIRQAIADPENQPSQFGTVPLSAYDQVRHDLDNARACYIRGDADRLQLKRNLAISRKWARRWKHIARLYHRLWRDAQGVAMAQADLAGELGEELARLRTLLPDGLLLHRAEIAMRMVADQHSEIYGETHEMTVAMRQDAAALRAAAEEMER